MLNYYITKIKICNNRASIIQMFEYLMTVPKLLLANPSIRRCTEKKVREFLIEPYIPDPEWNHAIRTMAEFLNDLRMFGK
jgi:hypothetical protein